MRKSTFCLLLLVLSISLSFGQYIVNFEGAGETKNAYASGNVTLNGISWNMTEALIGTESNDWKNGLRSARMHGYGTSAITMQENKSNGLGTLSFFYRRYGSDAQVNWKAEYSIDNGNSWIQIGSAFTAPASDTPSFFSELVNVSGNVRIRILSATGSGSTNKRLNIDDITLTDYAPVEPTIIINPSLLSGFNYEAMNGPSSAQSYILTANNLNPLTGNITVSASGSFEVSDNNTLFYPTLVLPYSGGTISELTLYVRLKAGLNPGTYQNENIVHTGGGATALLGVSGSVFISIIPLTGDGYYESFTSFVSIASLPGGWSLGDEYVYEGDFGTGSTGGLRGNGVLGIQLSGTYPNNMLTATLTLQNQTGVTLNNLDVSYTGKVARNDQPGTPKWVVSVNGTEIPELEYSTAEGINLTKNATLTGFNIAEGEYVVIQWFTTIVGTNGTRRQIGLDDVIVSTNINNNPFISVTAGLVPFLTGQGIPSEAQSYLLGGLELSQNINLTACTGFEISVDGGVNYSASTNVLPAFEGQVFIRMTGISSGFFTGYITHTSLGAEQFSLPVSGIVSNTSPEPVELPYLQASRLIAYPANTDITLEWIPGNGTGRLVKINTANSFTDPVDGYYPEANSIYCGSGEQVIFNGAIQFIESIPLNGCIVTGLTPATTYWFRIYEYNGCGIYTYYNTSQTMNNPISVITTNTESSGYYAGISGYGNTLKSNLHNLLRTTHTTRYSYDALWIKLPYTDEDLNNTNNITEIYTGWSVPKSYYGGGTSQWNREHTWSKSHGSFGENPPAGTDLHHLRPCDATVNSAKGNKDFDYASAPYYDSSPYNGYPQDTGCKTSTYAWEPRDEDKGDVARMIMYMAVRYEGTDTSYDLEIVDEINTSGANYGKLSTLLQWHIIDPPDSIETQRNNRIQELQGNRNPFIDEPLYAYYIWVPMPQNPSNITQTSFTANWTAPISATKYYLQLATDAAFNNIVPGYENLDINLNLYANITGLSNTNTYYYRLRSWFTSGYSMYSPYMAVTLSASASAQLNSGTPLTEYNLNDALLQLNLANTTWKDNVLIPANFTVNNAPVGLSLLSVQYLSSNSALLVLHFDNTDFDDNILNFSVTIDAAEINFPSSITTNALTIIAYIESPLTIQIQGQQLILNIQTVMEADAYTVFSSIEPYGTYSEISLSGNFDALIPTRWTCILPSDNTRFYKAAAIRNP